MKASSRLQGWSTELRHAGNRRQALGCRVHQDHGVLHTMSTLSSSAHCAGGQITGNSGPGRSGPEIVWSSTPRTPGIFSAATRRAVRSSSDPTTPQKCTTPSETTMSDSLQFTHLCLRRSASKRLRIAPSRSSSGELAPLLTNTRKRSARLDDPDELAVVQDRDALDASRLHQIGDFAESRQFADADHVARHNVR